MRIVVCVKEVLDPDAVNNYALAGRLEIGEDGKTLTQTAIPRLMNGYDEQAIEAALRLRDAGADCTITVVAAGADMPATVAGWREVLHRLMAGFLAGQAAVDPKDGRRTCSGSWCELQSLCRIDELERLQVDGATEAAS